MKAPNQLLKEEARKLFDYRDGMLYWRHAASGQRNNGRAITTRSTVYGGCKKFGVRLGGQYFSAHYLIWNWHHGITTGTVRFRDGDNGNFRIENLFEHQLRNFAPVLHPAKFCCPQCGTRVASPTPDIIAETVGLPPIQEAVLRAVWAGKGRPVQPEAIFTEMYSDDPDGGPGASKMYAAFKVALCHLREKLKGTGVSIENVGYRQGYRLIMKEARGQDGGVSQQGDDHRERGARP